ncbi:MAG: KTSC domain-containing protein [Pseudomonadota bacterium]|nr:KTSC domain-containing protein [Pseudomonadota bacterium]
MNTQTFEHPTIAMDAVESSQIAAIGHDSRTNTLAIRFKSKSGTGSLYHYANFTAADFTAFKGAESIGSHFYKFIKSFPDRHPYTKVDAGSLNITRHAPGVTVHRRK